MKVIYKPKGKGKTTELIKLAHNSGGYIVCLSQDECTRVFHYAKEIGYDIKFPISFNEFLNKQYHHCGIREFYIDNVDELIRRLSPTVKIGAITFNDDNLQE